MKTFTVLVLCIFALCCCQDSGPEEGAGSGGGKNSGKSKRRGPFHVCREKLNVTREDMTSAMDLLLDGECSSDPSEAAKCLMKCVLVQLKEMAEDGTPTLEELQQNYTLIPQKIGECNKIKAESSCESAYQVGKCLGKALPKKTGF